MVGITLIDTNVLLDVVTSDPHWEDWSLRKMEYASIRGGVAINLAVYAEVSVRFETIAAVDSMLLRAGVELIELPRSALFLAGKVFQRYRAAGGTRTGVLPDFFIGAHATVAGIPLISRDARRYRTYFPAIDLVTPQSTAS